MSFLTYGARVHADTVTRLIEHNIQIMRTQTGDARPTPICIWGLHGIGKTELVKGIAKRINAPLVYVAPAQFEEMGDLIGMPRIDGNVTKFTPPDWVPTQDGPGILLLDDVNRADDRILRGIMQLLQYYELVSWELPRRWLIILTANPDGGDYSVTPLDDAMLNRMLHITMDFNAAIWAQWAEKAGVDERGIYFVLAYPELVNGKRTTPRSLVQFFDLIAPFDDLNAELPMIKILGESCLDTETVQTFINFVHLKLDKIPGPEQIIDGNNFEQTTDHIKRLVNDGSVQRLDILSVVISRLINYLLSRSNTLSEVQLAQVAKFILLDFIPNDLRLSMAQELVSTKHPTPLSGLYANPEIGKLLLTKM